MRTIALLLVVFICLQVNAVQQAESNFPSNVPASTSTKSLLEVAGIFFDSNSEKNDPSNADAPKLPEPNPSPFGNTNEFMPGSFAGANDNIRGSYGPRRRRIPYNTFNPDRTLNPFRPYNSAENSPNDVLVPRSPWDKIYDPYIADMARKAGHGGPSTYGGYSSFRGTQSNSDPNGQLGLQFGAAPQFGGQFPSFGGGPSLLGASTSGTYDPAEYSAQNLNKQNAPAAAQTNANPSASK